MPNVSTWKASALGAACGIALVTVVRTIALRLYQLATIGTLDPMAVVTAPTAAASTYINLGLGLLCAGVGGYIAGRLRQSEAATPGILTGIAMALLIHANSFLWKEVRLGAIALVVLTIAASVLGAYVARRLGKPA